MSLIDETLNEDVRADSILSKLDAAEASGALEAPPETVVEVEQPTAPAPVVETVEPGPETTPVTVEDEKGHVDPELPVIEPPDSWKAEAKERFKALPRDLQAVIAERESEQKATFNRHINEAADTRRAAEASRKEAEERVAAAAQEQQRYAQQLQIVAQQMEAADPIISAYRNTDLRQLARDNPAQYTELDAAYKVRVSQIETLRAEQQRVQHEATRNWLQREQASLIAAVPEWSDATRRQADPAELRTVMASSYGYKPEEIEAVSDHRHVRVLRDAIEVSKLRAELTALKAEKAEREKVVKAAIVEKKVAPAAKIPTLRPGAASDASRSQADRSKALINRAGKARTLAEKAEILAQLD